MLVLQWTEGNTVCAVWNNSKRVLFTKGSMGWNWDFTLPDAGFDEWQQYFDACCNFANNL